MHIRRWANRRICVHAARIRESAIYAHTRAFAGLERMLYYWRAVWRGTAHSALRRAVISAPSSLAKSFSPSTSLLLFPYCYGTSNLLLADGKARRGVLRFSRVSQFFFRTDRSVYPLEARRLQRVNRIIFFLHRNERIM